MPVSDDYLNHRLPTAQQGQTEMMIYVLARHVGKTQDEAAVITNDFVADALSHWHNPEFPTRRELFETCERVFVRASQSEQRDAS